MPADDVARASTDLTTGYLKAPVLRDVIARRGRRDRRRARCQRRRQDHAAARLSGNLKTWSGIDRARRGATSGRTSPWNRARLGVAHVPEGRHVFAAMTVARTSTSPGSPDAVAAPASRATTSSSSSPGWASGATQLAGSLSGGEQQMLVIGRALMTGPSGPARRRDVGRAGAGHGADAGREPARHPPRAGVAMLLVEQSPHLIADVVDRVYVLEHGTITHRGHRRGHRRRRRPRRRLPRRALISPRRLR